MKSIITTLLIVAALVMTTGCSTEREEFSYGHEVPSYSDGELSAVVTVHRDRAEITLPKPLTYYIYLDGVFIKQVTTTANDEKVVVRALTPDTEYHLLIKALDGEKVLTKEETFTTRLSYASVIGLVEMNYYDGEEMLDFVHQMPGGDFIDQSRRYYYTEDQLCLRRTDAEGRVKWRSYIGYNEASVSDEGHIAAWSYNKVCRVNPETGTVMYEYDPGLKQGDIYSAYVCRDGSMVIVGRDFSDGNYYFYFARLDANGQLVHEEEGDQADELYEVHETADGNVVAMGRKGLETFVALTFDAEGRMIGEFSDYDERRDLGYRAYFTQSVRDKQGNIYFLGGAEYYTAGGAAPVVVVFKVDAQGKVVWSRMWVSEYDELFTTCMSFVDDDRLCVFYSGRTTNVALMTTGNEILHDVSLNANYDVLYGRPVNEDYTQFYLLDKYGRMIYIDTEGE